MPKHWPTSYKNWLDEAAQFSHPIPHKQAMAHAKYFEDEVVNQQANTTLESLTDAADTQQGWAQPANAINWHYYRFVGEPTGQETSLCGRWGAEDVNPDDLYDKNHGCADHCKACRALRA
jgi:hypothetical protein